MLLYYWIYLTRCEKEIKCSASLAFYLFSSTRWINSIKHEHSCKILYKSQCGSSFSLENLPSTAQTSLLSYWDLLECWFLAHLIRISEINPYLPMLSYPRRQVIPLFHTGHESPESPRIGFFQFGGIREVSFNFFSNRDVIRVSRDSDRMSLRIFGGIGSHSAGIAQEFITISKITLEHAARKLRNQLRIS